MRQRYIVELKEEFSNLDHFIYAFNKESHSGFIQNDKGDSIKKLFDFDSPQFKWYPKKRREFLEEYIKNYCLVTINFTNEDVEFYKNTMLFLQLLNNSNLTHFAEIDYEIRLLNAKSNDALASEKRDRNHKNEIRKYPLSTINFKSHISHLGSKEQKPMIAVIDSGVDYDHINLRERLHKLSDEIVYFDDKDKEYYGFDLTDEAEIGYDVFDEDGHGTKITGILSAYGADSKVIGLAPEAEILTIKIFKEGPDGQEPKSLLSKVCRAYILVFGFNRVKTINNSWHIYTDDKESVDDQLIVKSKLFECLLSKIVKKGIIPVFSAGNYENLDVNNIYPQKLKELISVGAIDENKQASKTSSYGEGICVWAPGKDVLSTTNSACGCDFEIDTGTSMAAPFVTAIVSILKDKKTTYSIEKIKKRLRKGAEYYRINHSSQSHGHILDYTKTLK